VDPFPALRSLVGPSRHQATAPPAGLPPRLLAWRVLQAVQGGAYADIALERLLGSSGLAAADRGLATELAYGCVRQRRLLQAWIDALGRRPAAAQPPKLRSVLELGLYQLLFCQRVPAAAAVHTSVALAQQLGLDRLAPVVNGLLRELLRRRDAAMAQGSGGDAGGGPGADHGPERGGAGTGAVTGIQVSEGPTTLEPWTGLELPADPATSLGLRHSLPVWLAEDLLRWRTAEQAEAFGRAVNSAAPMDLRVNPLRASREQLLAELAAAGVRAEPLPELADGLTLADAPGDVRQLPGYAEGLWCVQDRHAQAIVPLLAPQPGQRVLDACAAPGGKATQIAARLQGEGEVWAVDRSAARLRRVAANAERLGVGEILRPLEADATDLAGLRPEWRGHFDRILLDVPCSGLGTLARHADARWRIDPDRIAELVALQSRLLEGVAPLLAPGGCLVYATCTVEPRENGERIAAFLADRPDWRLRLERQWWPGREGGDGFYAAVIDGPGLGERRGG
jgi:16S rRNA (cytosine967-C5)-methyltransferase